VDAHDHLVSVDVHVALHQRDGLRQDVKAGSHEVHRKDLVVAHDAKNSFVVIHGFLRQKVNNDSRR
jgi:hypothetical protein